MRKTVQILLFIFLFAVIFLPSPYTFAQSTRRSSPARQPSVQELRRELKAMQQQMQQMQEKMRQQEEVIQKLSRQPTPTSTAPLITTTREEEFKREVKEEIMQDIKPSLAAVNKTFASQFNPAISLVPDFFFSSGEKERANMNWRSAELGLFASVDPFTRAYVFFNGTPDGVEVEEAAMVTTALPYSLTVKGGRFFADFGRLSKWHEHDLPFVNRPLVLEHFVDGESQADGVEVSYLAPTRQYLTLTTGMYNKIGGENERVDNLVPRNFSQFTYLWRAATFFNLNDSNSVDFGASYAYTPKVQIEGNHVRHLAGADLTYRYTPLSQAGYRGLVWGTEFLYNHENRPVGGFGEEESESEEDGESPQFKRKNAFGLYSYVEARLTRRFYAGFLFDWAQSLDSGVSSALNYTPYLTFWASDFQRFRFQFSHIDEPGNHDNLFFLQWTVLLGSHQHAFRDR